MSERSTASGRRLVQIGNDKSGEFNGSMQHRPKFATLLVDSQQPARNTRVGRSGLKQAGTAHEGDYARLNPFLRTGLATGERCARCCVDRLKSQP